MLVRSAANVGGGSSDAPEVPALARLTGEAPAMQQLRGMILRLANSMAPVSIHGESGSGKELAARAIHDASSRRLHPFVHVNCGAIPETLMEAEFFGYRKGAFTRADRDRDGFFQAAAGGSLFLDEVAELPLAMQVKLLRVLQTSSVQGVGSTEATPVNFRLITATNRNLEAEVREGRFREDLFYRIHVYPLHVPPLRERPEDIPPIVQHHLSLIAARENRPALRLTTSALEKLLAHSWPGNVRELINLLERAALLAGAEKIDAEHIVLPAADARASTPTMSSLLPYREAKVRFEQEYYSQLMRTADGNVSLAAKLGQKTRKEIYDALKRLGLDRIAFRN